MTRNKIWIALISFALIVSGCSSANEKKEESMKSEEHNLATTKSIEDTTESVTTEKETKQAEDYPEAYTAAMEAFSNYDLEKALQYLDIVIKNDPKTVYVTKAQALKSYILNLKYNAYLYTVISFTAGNKQYTKRYNQEEEEVLRIVDKLYEMAAHMEEEIKDIEESISFVLDNYPSTRYDSISDSRIKTSKQNISEKELTNYVLNGYPIPTDEELIEAFNYKKYVAYKVMTAKAFKRKEIDYAYLFYEVAVNVDLHDVENQLSNALFEEVVKLTEDDQKSELRIKAQKELEKNKVKRTP